MSITGVTEYMGAYKTKEDLYEAKQQKTEKKEYADNNKAADKKEYTSKKEYQDYLSEKFDGMTAKGYDVNINRNLLDKAAEDPKTAAWLEYNLGQLPGCMKSLQNSAAAEGGRIVSCNYHINGYDDISTDVYAVFESDPGTEEQKKRLEEIKEQQKEGREEQKKRLEARIEDRRNKLSMRSTDVDSLTEMAAQSAFTSAKSGMTGFDVKV